VPREPRGGAEDFRVSIGRQSFDPKDVGSHARRRATDARKRHERIAGEAGLEAPDQDAPEATIVQLERALSRTETERFRESYGLKLDQYVPNLAYLESLDARTVARLRRDPLVRACVPLHPELKLAPGVESEPSPTGEYTATLVDEADPGAVAAALAALGARDIRVFDDRALGGRLRLRYALDDVSQTARIADIPQVAAIQAVSASKADNVEAACTIQGGGASTHPIWDHGLHGEGQVINIFDAIGPLDVNHCFFADDPPNNPGPNHRKVLAVRNASAAPVDAHATFVAGCAAGDRQDMPGSARHRGGAWAAKLLSGHSGDLALNSMLAELTAAMGSGAFIHSNSWHDPPAAGVPAGTPTPYNQNASDVDTFTWTNENHLVLGSGGNVGEQIGPPGTAKNAICVNAAQADPNEMNLGDGNAGPTGDGRRKPDLMAVGCGINSAVAATACTTRPRRPCASSYATPHAAAAAAVVRQYFTEGWYPSGEKEAKNAFVPTGALLKAVLLNSTIDMTGVAGYPSPTEGWGIIKLDRTLYFRGGSRRLRVWDVRHVAGITDLSIQPHDLDVAEDAEQLKVTLVWSDPAPAAAAFANPVVNDLDLRVTAPDGTDYRGNQLTNGVSTPGANGTDTVNNVEMVIVNNPVKGKWRLDVIGHVRVLTAGQGQGYALVATATMRSKCFVGSAVYGDAGHPDVQLIREWRDRVRAARGAGGAAMTGLEAVYDRVGPPLAAVVRRNPRLACLLRERVFRPAVSLARARRISRWR
jgi:Subtilase family